MILAGCAEGQMAGAGAGGTGGAGGMPDARPTCQTSADCDDGNICTTDMCDRLAGMCVHQNSCCTADIQCNDNLVCTDDRCMDGSCRHTPRTNCCMADTDCDDSDACTMDHCDTSNQTCTHTPTTGCCTSDLQCEDSNPCTQDACMNMACAHTPVSGCCQADADCNDTNPCTTDTCNTSAHVCMHAPVTGCCITDNQCDDGNICTTDGCNPTSHQCTHTGIGGCCNADAECNDGNACTNDVCNVSHQCVHTGVSGCCNQATECDDGNACTTDSCNTTTHVCAHAGVPNCCTASSQCDDRNVCNGAESCVSMTCMPGTALNCNDGNACTNDACDPIAGCQHSNVSCDDGNACTTDSCSTATGCAHTTINCDDGDICSIDGCNFTTGCTHQAIPNCAPRPNDTCANAIDVTSMTDIPGSTLGAHDDINPPASCSAAAGNGGPDVFYRLTISQTEWVTFDTFGSAINTVLYVLDACGGNVLFSGQGCNDDSGCNAPDGQNSAIALHLTPGTYIIVIDSFGAGGAGAFNLHIRHSGGACESAQPISFGTPVASTTIGQPNHTNPSCTPANNAPDRLFFFYLCPISGTFSVQATTCSGTLYDSVVYLRYGTCGGGDLGCDDDGCGLFAGPSNMRANNIATGGGLYFVVVDGYGSASSGNFTLTVQ